MPHLRCHRGVKWRWRSSCSLRKSYLELSMYGHFLQSAGQVRLRGWRGLFGRVSAWDAVQWGTIARPCAPSR